MPIALAKTVKTLTATDRRRWAWRKYLKTKLLIVLTLLILIMSCGKKGDQLDNIVIPIWKESDIYYNIPEIPVYQVILNGKPPFYKGPAPFSYKIGKSPRGLVYFYKFEDFINFYINPISPIQGARTRDTENRIVAEARVRYFSIKDPKSEYYIQGRELEEFHYDKKGKLTYYCKSIIDPNSGFKIKETNQVGEKNRDYYFIWPVR